jgi:tRNA-dihydrouridine synthase 3
MAERLASASSMQASTPTRRLIALDRHRPRARARGFFSLFASSSTETPSSVDPDARPPPRPAVKKPHVDGRRQFSDVPDGLASVERIVTDAQVRTFRDSIRGKLLLAPLTKGGNLPFRRLCVSLGCEVTVSEMVFARFALKKNPVELARLRKHDSETLFGVQIATNQITEGVNAGRLAHEVGADFVDLNCGCPIHETWKRGLGAALLKKPRKLERLVRGIADGIPIPLTVKIRLGAGSSEAPAHALAEAVENAGAAAVVIHGRTKEARYTKAANWETIGAIQAERGIPVVGNGDILTRYELNDRMGISNAHAAMVGRGALIKPWIFKEAKEGIDWEPSAEERIAVYLTLCGYFQDHFRADELGKKRYMEFMPWHFGFFCRYRPLPEATYGEMASRYPLLQTRLGIVAAKEVEGMDGDELPALERLLRCESEEAHARMSEALWDALGSVERAVELFEDIAKDGSLERWEREAEVARRSGRGGDEGMGGGDAIRG